MTFQKLFVSQKLSDMDQYLKEISDLFGLPDKEILADSGKIHIAERLLQLIVDTMIDINQHFIKELDFSIPEDFQSTFSVLAKNNILPADFAEKIASVVGLRNLVVHRYEVLDKNLFISTFRKEHSDFQEYIKLITAYLGK